MITRKNYELYFIDYLEGTLAKKELAMVNTFLKENPDLKEELTELSSVSPLIFEEKVDLDFSYLKKQSLIEEANEEDFFIGKLEGDLSLEQQKLLNLYVIDNPEKKLVLTSFENTKLSPEVLMFPNKRSLKKRNWTLLLFSSGLAACILVLLYVNLNLDNTEKIPLTAKKNDFKLILDKVEPKKEEKAGGIELKLKNIILPKRKKEENLAQQTSPIEIPTPNLKEVSDSREKIELANINQKKIIVNFEEDLHKELIALNSVLEKTIPEPVIEQKKTEKEYTKEKIMSFIAEKATGKKDKSQSLLAFATKKATEIPLPRFIDYKNQKTEIQQVRTIKIGNLFSIKRKTRIEL